MTVDRIAKAKRVAANWAARLDNARARAVPGGQIELLERRTLAAAQRVEGLTRAALERDRKRAASTALDTSLIRLADRIAARAPETAKRWEDERAKEPKRIKERKKQLAKRVSKDLGRSPGRLRARRAVSPPVAETWPSGPIIPWVPPPIDDAPPPRDGLLPGDYTILPVGVLMLETSTLPQVWTPEYVGSRMIEAHAVLRRLPMVTRPKEFGDAWPLYKYEAGELAHQAGAGTLEFGRNRVIRGTSADEVARMNEALCWPMEHLQGEPSWVAEELNLWAADPDDYATPHRGVEVIANALNARGVPVR